MFDPRADDRLRSGHGSGQHRGTKDETLVESLDMIPTFLDAFGGLVDKEHLLEGGACC